MGTTTRSDESVDAGWSALCGELEDTARAVALKFSHAEQAHLSFTEVHLLAQMVDLAHDGHPFDDRLVGFATQCLAQVAGRAVRTSFRPNYFSEYWCLNVLWKQASASRARRLGLERTETQRAA